MGIALAAAAAAGGVALLAPATPASATAWDCPVTYVPGHPDSARAKCENFNGGTRVRAVVYCVSNSGIYRTVYGPWVGSPGTYSDAYCGVGYHEYKRDHQFL